MYFPATFIALLYKKHQNMNRNGTFGTRRRQILKNVMPKGHSALNPCKLSLNTCNTAS